MPKPSSFLRPGCRELLAGSLDRLLADLESPCAELLNITQPLAVRAAHDRYLDAGATMIRTNTPGGSPERLDRYRMHDEAFIVSYMAAEHAVKSARAAEAATGRARWVLGVARVEGRTRLTGFLPLDRVERAARTMASGLAGGGADAILVESIQDPARLASAIGGVRRGLADAGRSLPILLTLRFDPFFASPTATARDRVTGDLAAAASAAAGLGVDAMSVARANLADSWFDTVRVLARTYPGRLFVDCDPGRDALVRLLGDPALGPRVTLVGGGVSPDDTAALRRLIAGLPNDGARSAGTTGCVNDNIALPLRRPGEA
ncbi:MAG: homocysteine S-methyltransferase family protein [Alphaproteobacteria bacterium]|nr:homocysteine S-methyltransferase family protein [Alphaproteobacteria bacterium]